MLGYKSKFKFQTNPFCSRNGGDKMKGNRLFNEMTRFKTTPPKKQSKANFPLINISEFSDMKKDAGKILDFSQRINVDVRKLTLAKALCARLFIEEMTDERSIKAVRAAEKFGKGYISKEELKKASEQAKKAYDEHKPYAHQAYASANIDAIASIVTICYLPDNKGAIMLRLTDICKAVLNSEIQRKGFSI